MGIKERKEREKESRREDILNAAERVFFQKGFGEATMDEIAGIAELSKGTLYLYYRTKEDLYLAIALRGGDVMHRMFQETVDRGGDPVEQLLALSATYVRFFHDHRRYFQMYYAVQSPGFHAEVSHEIIQECGRNDQKVWGVVVSVVERAIDEGLMHRELNPLDAAVMLGLNMNGILRVMDGGSKYWSDVLNVNLERILGRSFSLLLSSMLTRKGKRLHPELLVAPEPEKAPA